MDIRRWKCNLGLNAWNRKWWFVDCGRMFEDETINQKGINHKMSWKM